MSTHAHIASGELPPEAFDGRWSSARKETVLLALRRREITVADALRRWGMSIEELDAWITAYRGHGRSGLKATVVQGRLL